MLTQHNKLPLELDSPRRDGDFDAVLIRTIPASTGPISFNHGLGRSGVNFDIIWKDGACDCWTFKETGQVVEDKNTIQLYFSNAGVELVLRFW
mgnify:CR=1 FL=1